MEIVIQSIMDTIVVILNYQPLIDGGIEFRVIHFIMFYLIWWMWKNK